MNFFNENLFKSTVANVTPLVAKSKVEIDIRYVVGDPAVS